LVVRLRSRYIPAEDRKLATDGACASSGRIVVAALRKRSPVLAALIHVSSELVGWGWRRGHVIFGGFSANALVDLITGSQASLVIAQDGSYRRGAEVKLKSAVDEARAILPVGETRGGVQTHWHAADQSISHRSAVRLNSHVTCRGQNRLGGSSVTSTRGGRLNAPLFINRHYVNFRLLGTQLPE